MREGMTAFTRHGWLPAALLLLPAVRHGAGATLEELTKLSPPAPHRFETASIRLVKDIGKLPREKQQFYESPSGAGQFIARNMSLEALIGSAYGIDTTYQLAGKPEWFDDAYYDVAARPEGNVGLTYEQLRPYLQDMLQERLHLSWHREARSVEGYALVIARGEPKLTRSPVASNPDRAAFRPGQIQGMNEPVKVLARMLGICSERPVQDKTGLNGNYDFELRYAPLEDTDSALPSIFAALPEQLGLKLERQMVPIEMFVIDHVDRVPTEN